jgi:hypothetical protein
MVMLTAAGGLMRRRATVRRTLILPLSTVSTIIWSNIVDKKAFITAIQIAVEDNAVAGTISLLTNPPGRRPAEHIVKLSTWFNRLPLEDRENVERVVHQAVKSTVFGFLCVLDGARAIENGPAKGSLELRYRGITTDVHLNGNCGDMLHDLFNKR